LIGSITSISMPLKKLYNTTRNRRKPPFHIILAHRMLSEVNHDVKV